MQMSTAGGAIIKVKTLLVGGEKAGFYVNVAGLLGDKLASAHGGVHDDDVVGDIKVLPTMSIQSCLSMYSEKKQRCIVRL